MPKRRCKQCGDSFLALKGEIRSFCSVDCGFKLANKNIKKAKQMAYKNKTRELKKKKEADKSLKRLCVELQVLVNKYIGLRDKGKPCISCGALAGESGHFYSIGSKYQCSRFRFNLINIHRQCGYCNQHLSGNPLEYRKGLIERYGESYLDDIEEFKRMADSGEEKRLTKEEVRSMKTEFRLMIKEIE